MEPVRIIELDLEKLAPKLLWANLLLLAAFAAAYHFFGQPLSFGFSWSGIAFFIFGYIILIILHEIFHLIGFVLFGKVALSSLNYGVNLKMGIAYATTSTPVQNKAMRKVLLLPFWTTAVLPTIMGFWFDSQTTVLLGAMLAAGAIGDFIMYKELRQEKDDTWILDDPALPRLHIYNERPNNKSTVSN